jgi:hypothetical protein
MYARATQQKKKERASKLQGNILESHDNSHYDDVHLMI